MKKCNVCLAKCISTVSVQKSDKNNVKWLRKLEDVIPELEWLGEYMICEDCTKHLEKAWEFKKFVLDREKNQKDAVNVKGVCLDDDAIKNHASTEYFSNDKHGMHCEICFKIFTTTTQLHQHKLQTHGDLSEKEVKLKNIFTCYNCNVSFNIKKNLISHIEYEHREAKLYSFNPLLENSTNEDNLHDTTEDCDVWDKVTVTKSDITEDKYHSTHFETCLNNVDDGKLTNPCDTEDTISKEKTDYEANEESCPFFCQDCRIKFTSSQDLNLHNFSKHNTQKGVVEPELVVKKRRGRKPLRKFNCEICNEEFDYVKLVIEHCVSIHAMDTKIVKPYSCEKCNMRFVSSANLDQHRNYHNKNRSHICSLCGKGFITKSDLTVHEYTHYNRRNYKCTICNKAFNTNKNLRTHNLVVHTDRSLWKYACSICEKRFPLKTNYDQHLRRHTGEKEHACHICKKPFISKSELQRHIHMHSNIRAFKCTNCGKEYKERRTYQAHLAKKHGIGEVKITVREKKFVCHICPSQFYDKQKLMRHICSHSGIKPFPCYACDKKFTDKSYLKHHLKTAHNIIEPSKIEEIQ